MVQRASRGDKPAFETLVRRHQRRVFHTTLGVTHNTDDAKDAMQETFLKVYQHLKKFRGNARFTTWLTRIAVNEGLMMLRKRRPNIVSLEDVTPLEVKDGGASPEQSFAQTQLNRILSLAASELGPGPHVVFVLRHTEELSIKEIAQMLGLSIPAVKSRLRRVRLDLTEKLNKTLPATEFTYIPKALSLRRN
ncbi:MAG: sigma-70 family RNA polymerase sigma factor [Candidatus Acidiferrum sp.]